MDLYHFMITMPYKWINVRKSFLEKRRIGDGWLRMYQYFRIAKGIISNNGKLTIQVQIDCMFFSWDLFLVNHVLKIVCFIWSMVVIG